MQVIAKPQKEPTSARLLNDYDGDGDGPAATGVEAALGRPSTIKSFSPSLSKWTQHLDPAAQPLFRSCQGLSISSLPFYASFAKFFLVLTPRVAYGGRVYVLSCPIPGYPRNMLRILGYPGTCTTVVWFCLDCLIV